MRQCKRRNIDRVKFLYAGDRDHVMITFYHHNGTKITEYIPLNSHWHSTLCDLLKTSSVYYHSEYTNIHYDNRLVVSRTVITSLRMI